MLLPGNLINYLLKSPMGFDAMVIIYVRGSMWAQLTGQNKIAKKRIEFFS